MIETEAFPNIRVKIDELLGITNEYCFYDLVRAVYCINLCINNRSVLESCLALNACLIEYSAQGNKTIKNYSEFQNFFNLIYKEMQPGWADDYTVEDFGDVRISYQGSFYRVIVGTGHNNVFACMNFLPILARETSNEDALYQIMEYSSGVIEYFLESNVNDNVQEKRFVLPSEKLFDRVQLFFEKELNKYDIEYISEYYEPVQNIIEKSHFVFNEDEIYPLYNVSILLDIYDLWERKLDDDKKIEIANHGIVQRIYSLFETDRSQTCSMFAPAMIFPDKKYDSNQRTYTFIAKCSRGAIIALNQDEYEGDSLNKEILKIRDIHQQGKLQIAEIYNRFDKKGLRGVLIPRDVPLEFIIYDSFTNPSQMHFSLGEENRNYNCCTALDIIYYLDFMDDLDELFDYITYNKRRDYESSFGFGSDAAHFFTWKSQGHYIAKGAIVFNLVDVGYDTENEAVVAYFRENLKHYPFHKGDYIFQEPFAWRMEIRDSGETEIFLKYGMGFGGVFMPIPQGNYIFLANNVEFYKNVPDLGEYRQLIPLLEEIISEGIETIKPIFDGCFQMQTGIQISFMPMEYAIGAGHEEFLREDRKYVYSDTQFFNCKWLIRYVVKDIHQIYQDIQQANNREVEFGILKEILFPMLIRMPELMQLYEIEEERYRYNKKKVDVFSTTIDYSWNNDITDYSPKDFHFHEVRKRIANTCFSKKIEPGCYRGDEANQIIRSMQRAIVEDFEKEIAKYSREELHNSLLAYHSTLLHEINVNRQRYGSYGDLDEHKDKEVRERIIKVREKAKHDDRNALYLIETNLFLRGRSEDSIASADNICFLIAYANWLVILNDVADMCHFSDKEAYIEITSEFVVDTLSDDSDTDEIGDFHRRVYRYSDGLSRKRDIDKQYFEKVKSSFLIDVGFEFELFAEVLSYFAYAVSSSIAVSCGGNVYKAKYTDLVTDLGIQMNGEISKEKIVSIFEYLILEPDRLKTIKGKTDFYLPIGNRRERNVRFELRPLVKDGEDVVFSPITMDRLKKDWINGIFDFVLPYEVEMDSTKKILAEWKNQYEKRIVFDIEAVFEKKKFDVIKHNFELMKLNKEHPQYLGDYDVFAVDIKNKSVWIVECKVIEKVATYYDMFRQQKRFFQEHKEDEKFQRRIDYLNSNLEKVLCQMEIEDYSGYKVKAYMCMNKVLESRYKQVAFPIVAYSELVDIINNS